MRQNETTVKKTSRWKKGGLPLIMAYIDDVNCLLPLDDVELFLRKIMNMEENMVQS